ncbi:MAG: ornithine carbamoyltransferase [Ignavibacteria bacterium]|jgi:ornithine carbamoyltransferase|nr:ornithine carbamoyltransferase [Ignavibacteria bacterium]MCU7502315.1 ornithine carbamoyltransferase [Ignavibacteria bacterium]MCU7516641.1 ornithine carbamoyltransferase [Ignavibacteria bacterium]
MVSDLYRRHFLSDDDWTRQELDTVFETAFDLKKMFARREPHRFLQDKTLFNIFFEQSTRTRNSMEAGMTQLGGHAHDLTADKMQISHGESAKDTAIILSRMGHGIACRNCFYGTGKKYLDELAKYASVPVMSLQDDVYHPFQGLADLMTIFEHFGRNAKGLKLTISWAYADTHSKPLSVPQTQALLFPRYGIDVTIAHPEEFPLRRDIMEKACLNAKKGGGSLRFTSNMDEAFEGAQVVIPKNWGGFGRYGVEDFLNNEDECKKEMKASLEKYKSWICDERRIRLASKGVKLMHALPADRGHEVTDEVLDNPEISIVYDEAENRLHTAKAIMALTM